MSHRLLETCDPLTEHSELFSLSCVHRGDRPLSAQQLNFPFNSMCCASINNIWWTLTIRDAFCNTHKPLCRSVRQSSVYRSLVSLVSLTDLKGQCPANKPMYVGQESHVKPLHCMWSRSDQLADVTQRTQLQPQGKQLGGSGQGAHRQYMYTQMHTGTQTRTNTSTFTA